MLCGVDSVTEHAQPVTARHTARLVRTLVHAVREGAGRPTARMAQPARAYDALYGAHSKCRSGCLSLCVRGVLGYIHTSSMLRCVLADTNYTVSGARDHYRQQTMAGGFNIERAPLYNNFFSELPHYPATTLKYVCFSHPPASCNCCSAAPCLVASIVAATCQQLWLGACVDAHCWHYAAALTLWCVAHMHATAGSRTATACPGSWTAPSMKRRMMQPL